MTSAASSGTPITRAARPRSWLPCRLQHYSFTGWSWSGWCASKAGSKKVSAEESDAYFHSRPLDSRIGAWASPQSQVIASRSVLVTNAARYGAQFLLNPPRPPHWGGYRLVPQQWEFWQGRKSRLHDRLRYLADDAGAWRRERLAP